MILRRYGIATTIDGIPLITRDLMDYIDLSTVTFAEGDVTVSKDGGEEANITTLPVVAPAGGTSLQIALSEDELLCARLVITLSDQSDPKVFEDQRIIVETFGDAAAQYSADFNADFAMIRTYVTNIYTLLQTLDGALRTFVPNALTAISGTQIPAILAELADIEAQVGVPVDFSSVISEVETVQAQAIQLQSVLGLVRDKVNDTKLVADLIKSQTDSLPASPSSEVTLQSVLQNLAGMENLLSAVKFHTDNLPDAPADNVVLQSTKSDVDAARTEINQVSGLLSGSLTTAITSLASVAADIQSIIGAIKNRTDNLPTSPASQESVSLALQQLGVANQTLVDVKATAENLDEAIAGEIDLGALTEDVAGITLLATDIKAKTDALPADPASESNVTTVGSTLEAAIADIAAGNFTLTTTNLDAMADAIWDELMAAHTTEGSAADKLALILAQFAGTVAVSAPVVSSDEVLIIKGDDYFYEDGRSLQWAEESLAWPDLDGATVNFIVGTFTKEGTVSTVDGLRQLMFELEADETSAFDTGVHFFWIKATLASAHVATLVHGKLKVSDQNKLVT